MTTKHLKMLESEENMEDKSKKYFNAIENALAGPAGYSSKTGRKIKKYRASSLFFHRGWTGRILAFYSVKSYVSGRRLGNRNVGIPASLGSYLVRTYGSHPADSKQAKKI